MFANSVLGFVPQLFDAQRSGEGKPPEWVCRSVTVEFLETAACARV